MYPNGRFFPSEYYDIPVSSRSKKIMNFCNRPLSPVDVQNLPVSDMPTSSSINSLPKQNTVDEAPTLSPYLAYYPSERLDDIEVQSDVDHSIVGHSVVGQTVVDPDFEDHSHELDVGTEDTANSSKDTSHPEETESHSSPNMNKVTSTVEKNIKKKCKGKDYCIFCESLVLNFARHIHRNHKLEKEVQEIISLPPGCGKRKSLLTTLRKKGNYLNSSIIVKPIKKPHLEESQLLPCPNCLGFYSAKQLWRHIKRCTGNNQSNAQALGQTFLLKNLRVDNELRNKVFPRMRPDMISATVKQDSLICAFGSRYIKTHRELHFINVASRKMRELAKLLIEVRNINKSITNLFEALRPQHFDTLVQAAKKVAKFDTENNYYKSPTFAMNISTSLKQCCDIAIIYALKKKDVFGSVNTASAEADLKTVISLLDAHWRFEVSTQASNDLHVKKWNKITIVPLANDLKLLREYLLEESNKAVEKFKKKQTKKTYTTLMELIYCKVLILNRRRPGELQRLPLYLYENSDTTSNYEEFSEAISESEKILMKKFKRIVIRGKRGRGVPVLLSPDVQEQIKLLLDNRDQFLNKSNMFIFGNPNTIEPISGYKVLRKYVRMSGVKNPDSLTSTKLRKHLATLCQLFSMTESDIEQLSSFMGHTPGVHRDKYRLPDDVFQCSKITKLLLLMEKGGASTFKGKSLDEIEINLEEDLMEDKVNDESGEAHTNESINIELFRPENNLSLAENSDSKTTEIQTHKKKSMRVLVPWTDEQKQIVKTYFQDHIENKRPPKRGECEDLMEQHPSLLKDKGWLKIKVFIQNVYTKKT